MYCYEIFRLLSDFENKVDLATVFQQIHAATFVPASSIASCFVLYREKLCDGRKGRECVHVKQKMDHEERFFGSCPSIWKKNLNLVFISETIISNYVEGWIEKWKISEIITACLIIGMLSLKIRCNVEFNQSLLVSIVISNFKKYHWQSFFPLDLLSSIIDQHSDTDAFVASFFSV